MLPLWKPFSSLCLLPFFLPFFLSFFLSSWIYGVSWSVLRHTYILHWMYEVGKRPKINFRQELVHETETKTWLALLHSWFVCVCVSVCLWERERDRLFQFKSCIVVAVVVVVVVALLLKRHVIQEVSRRTSYLMTTRKTKENSFFCFVFSMYNRVKRRQSLS